MPNHGAVGVCSTHLWATTVPCPGCARENEQSAKAIKARRETLAEKILVAWCSQSGLLQDRELRLSLPRLALELADKFTAELVEAEPYEHP